MELNIFDLHLVHSLYSSIEENLQLYESGNFDEILKKQSSHIRKIPNVFINENDLKNLTPKQGGENDSKNAYILYKSFTNFTPYLAVDERIWVTLCHQHAKTFVAKRWLKSSQTEKEKISSIKTHFFARGNRAIERGNVYLPFGGGLMWYAVPSQKMRPKLSKLFVHIQI